MLAGKINRFTIAILMALPAGVISQSSFAACPSTVGATVTVTDNSCVNFNFSDYPLDTNLTISTGGVVTGANAVRNVDGRSGAIVNDGTISGTTNGIYIDGVSGYSSGNAITSSITNNGFIYTSGRGIFVSDDYGADPYGATITGSIENTNIIDAAYDGIGIYGLGIVEGDINNSGTITGGWYALQAAGAKINGKVVNSGTMVGDWSGILISGDYSATFGPTIVGGLWNTSSTSIIQSPSWAIWIMGELAGGIHNDGVIEETGVGGSYSAIKLANYNGSPFISEIVGGLYNSGTIRSATMQAIELGHANTSIDFITNTGLIEGQTFGITSLGTIGSLNNYQGSFGSGVSALTYAGNLPTFYNMIVNGDQYGQLAVDYSNFTAGNSYSGTMTFGIFGGDAVNGIAASQLKTRVYEDVVTGIVQADYNNTFTNGASFGNFNGVAWVLRDAAWRTTVDPTHRWDLVVFNLGSDAAEPQRAMLEQRQQAIRDGLDYDCKQFDKDGICVSFKARYSSFGDEHEGAGVLTVAKRIDTNLRIGGFIDERVDSNEVNGVQMESGLPMLGAFAAYSSGKDGTGLQARLSAAFEHGTAQISRMDILDPTAHVSGKADVDSFGVAQRLGWGFGLANKAVLTPYLGVRYTEAKRAAYTEDTDNVPFTYDAYGEHRTTGTLGADLNGDLSKNVTYRLGAGLDYDFSNCLDTFNAYSDIEGLGSMTYVSTAEARDLRAFGLAGLGFNIDTTKTLTLDGNVSQMDYGSDLAYSLMAGYQMAF